MALTSDNVRVAVTGALSVAPTGTAAPTNGDSTLNAAFKDLGYFSEDGLTEARDRSTNTIQGWQNGDILREVVTESGITFEFTMVETKAETVALYYGANVDPATGQIVIVPSKTGGRKSFVLDIIDGDEFIRAYAPSGEIVEVGEQVYASGEPIGYPVTLRCYSDPSIQDDDGNSGSLVKWYSSLVVPAP